jgi:hypothetical protein
VLFNVECTCQMVSEDAYIHDKGDYISYDITLVRN